MTDGAGEAEPAPSTVERLIEQVRRKGRISARRPTATYRVQLGESFGFDDAARLVPYLDELGVTDLYLSPPFRAAAGSTHGYDVIDHNAIREELGGEAAFARLSSLLRERQMGALVDFVPNHMGIGPLNAWWMDLLENGPSSLYAPCFDVDWRPVKAELANKVLVPVLGDQFGAVLERGELRLVREQGSFFLHYFEHRFPITPRQVPAILGLRGAELRARLGDGDHDLQELLSICTALEKLAPREEVDRDKVAERAREKEVAKRRLAALCEKSAVIREHVDENIRILNGTPGDPRSFDRLAETLDHQVYRLAHWRVAGEEINYRRFFDINSLAAIRMEDEAVFSAAHRLILRLLTDGTITGLRIDHPDGLYAPTRYFAQLQERFLVELCRAEWLSEGHDDASFEALRAPLALAARAEIRRLPRLPLYVVVEKILEGRERMPASWQADGSTGYDFLSYTQALFADGRSRERFDAIYADFIGYRLDFPTLVRDCKEMIMRSSMASEINVLSHRLNRISEGDRRTRDFTLNALSKALVEYIASLPIYRTYVEGQEPGDVDARDRQYIEATCARARRRSPMLNASIFDFLRDILLLRHPDHLDERQRAERVEFVRKLQQVTGPVTAKAVEDTAFYIYNRLVALNEVGSDPAHFGDEPAEFHRRNAERLARWPGSLNATSTHDTKRGEDTRLRILALSELPDDWAEHLRRFAAICRPHKRTAFGEPAPDANEELLFYQTVIGALPDDEPGSPGWASFVDRVAGYVDKALKEAKTHTSWTSPDEEYQRAAEAFVRGALGDAAFVAAVRPLARRAAAAARVHSLAQVALKIASPGVSDVYQGAELWDLTLVDPDNRRPVEWARRRELLAALGRRAEDPATREALAREVSAPEALADGRAKLLLLREGLRLRRRHPELFLDGEYLPLEVEGPQARHVVAFARRSGPRQLVCVVPRLVAQLAPERGAIAWQGRVVLPPELTQQPMRDVITGRAATAESLDLAALFDAFPVALLLGER